MINIEGLSFQYSGAEQTALKDINLRIRDGEFVLVTGPSGGGKSTLCRCCNGLIPHFYGGTISGRIEIDGINTLEHSTSELATKVAIVFQDPENQLVTTDVEREIAFGLENLAIPERVIARRIEESLDTLGIVSLRHRPLQELSGGEKQKVAIASVLALHPSVLILDEPTSELDPKGAEDVLSVLLRLNDELGLSIMLVEHRMDRVVQFADRLIIVDQGTIVADGPVDELMNHNYDIITSRGIAVPPIIRLVQQIKKKGSVIEKIPLTVKEGRFLLEGSYRQALPQKPALKVQPCKAKQLVRIDKLWHSYNDETAALKGVSFAIDEGEFVAIMGRNASGKTTLVKHFNRLLEPSKGRVTVDGIDTRKSTIAELAKKVGFIFQNPNDHLFADTVEEELSTTLKNLGLQKSEISVRVDETLELFSLEKYRKTYPRLLSGGEKQRVAVASVLVAKPKIVILDEPTRGMEYRLKGELMSLMNEYRLKGNAVVLISHDVELVAEYADRVILLSEGKIVVDGDRHDVLSRALLFSPQVNRLMQSFSEYGVPDTILTVDEALDILP